MRIINLQAENVKRIKAVDITPDPDSDLVVVAGRNAQGKTSVLDAISYALGGAAAAKGTSKPIRDGEDSAEVVLDLDEIVVTRSWSADGKSKLTVAAKSGAKFPAPQDKLNDLIGKLSFDPLAFAQQDAKSQRATLLDLVDLPFNVGENEAARQAAFDNRTAVNRRVREQEAQLAAMSKPAADVPDVEVSASEAVKALQAAVAVHAAASQRDAYIADLVARRDRLRADLNAVEQQIEEAQGLELATPDLPDIDALQVALDNVEATNQAVRAARDYRTLHEQLTADKAEAERLSQEIKACDEVKAAGLREAKMPIDGLGFDTDGVTYQGNPFAQASGAEQLRVSMAIAMSMNPEIRVIRITDGSLLDSSNMALIEEMAGANDFQVWVERVDESGAVGVVIEDGEVRA